MPGKTIWGKLRGLWSRGPANVMPVSAEKVIEECLPRLSFEEKLRLRERLSEVRRMDFEPAEILLHVDSSIELNFRTRSCAKEPMTLQWLQSELRAGDVVYDIGANIGAYTLIAAKLGGGEAKVFAFEPGFQNYHQLCRNVLLNRCQHVVIPLQMALCRATGLEQFHYQNLSPGGSLHVFSRNIDYQGEAFQPVYSVPTVGFALDDLVRVGRLPGPTLMKVDVDGLEHDILLGARAVLADARLRGVLIEINEELEETKHILAAMHQAGLTAKEKHHLKKGMHNYVFERRASTTLLRPEEVPVTARRGAWRTEGRAA